MAESKLDEKALELIQEASCVLDGYGRQVLASDLHQLYLAAVSEGQDEGLEWTVVDYAKRSVGGWDAVLVGPGRPPQKLTAVPRAPRAPTPSHTGSQDEGLDGVERWMVDYENMEGEPQHAVLSWLSTDPTKALPEVGEELVRLSDVRAALAAVREHQGREGLTEEEAATILGALEGHEPDSVSYMSAKDKLRKLSEGGTDG